MPNEIKYQAMRLSDAGGLFRQSRNHYGNGLTATIWTLSGIVLAACGSGHTPIIGDFLGINDKDGNPEGSGSVTLDPDAVTLTEGALAFSPATDEDAAAFTHNTELTYDTGRTDDNDDPIVLMVAGPAVDATDPVSITLPANITAPRLVWLHKSNPGDDMTAATIKTGTREQFETDRNETSGEVRAFIIGVLDPNLGASNPSVTWHAVTTTGQLYNAPPVLSNASTDLAVTEDDDSDTATGTLSHADINDHDSYTYTFSTAERGSYTQVDAGGNWEGRFGTFAFTASTGEWTYTLDNDNAMVNALRGERGNVAAQTLTETIYVRVSDGTNTATRAITITITGADDAPSVTGTVRITEMINTVDTNDNDYSPFAPETALPASPTAEQLAAEVSRIARLLNYADPEGDSLTAIRFTGTLPDSSLVSATFTDDGTAGTAVAANTVIEADEISSLVFTLTNANPFREGSFTYTFDVTDDPGTIGSGTAWSATSGQFTLNVIEEVNLPPAIDADHTAALSATEDQDGEYNPFTGMTRDELETLFGFSDPNNAERYNSLGGIRFTENLGTLIIKRADDTTPRVGETIVFDDIAGLVFESLTLVTEDTTYSIPYEVYDGEFWSNENADPSRHSGTLEFTVEDEEIATTNGADRFYNPGTDEAFIFGGLTFYNVSGLGGTVRSLANTVFEFGISTTAADSSGEYDPVTNTLSITIAEDDFAHNYGEFVRFFNGLDGISDVIRATQTTTSTSLSDTYLFTVSTLLPGQFGVAPVFSANGSFANFGVADRATVTATFGAGSFEVRTATEPPPSLLPISPDDTSIGEGNRTKTFEVRALEANDDTVADINAVFATGTINSGPNAGVLDLSIVGDEIRTNVELEGAFNTIAANTAIGTITEMGELTTAFGGLQGTQNFTLEVNETFLSYLGVNQLANLNIWFNAEDDEPGSNLASPAASAIFNLTGHAYAGRSFTINGITFTEKRDLEDWDFFFGWATATSALNDAFVGDAMGDAIGNVISLRFGGADTNFELGHDSTVADLKAALISGSQTQQLQDLLELVDIEVTDASIATDNTSMRDLFTGGVAGNNIRVVGVPTLGRDGVIGGADTHVDNTDRTQPLTTSTDGWGFTGLPGDSARWLVDPFTNPPAATSNNLPVARGSNTNNPRDINSADLDVAFNIIGTDPDNDDITYTIEAVNPASGGFGLDFASATTTTMSGVSFSVSGTATEASRVNVTVDSGYGTNSATDLVIGTLGVANTGGAPAFTFDPNAAAFSNLATDGGANSRETLTFRITPNDGTEDGVATTVSFGLFNTATGAPVITATNQYPTLTEVNSGTVTATGIYTISDDAALSALTFQSGTSSTSTYASGGTVPSFTTPTLTAYSIGSAISTTYGSMTFSAFNSVSGLGQWTYTVNNASLNQVNSGESVKELVTLTVSDGTTTTSTDFIITIDGLDEPSSFPLPVDDGLI